MNDPELKRACIALTIILVVFTPIVVAMTWVAWSKRKDWRNALLTRHDPTVIDSKESDYTFFRDFAILIGIVFIVTLVTRVWFWISKGM